MLTMTELQYLYSCAEQMGDAYTRINGDDLRQIAGLAIAGRYLLENHVEILDKYSVGIIADKDGQFQGIATKEQRINAAIFNIIEDA